LHWDGFIAVKSSLGGTTPFAFGQGDMSLGATHDGDSIGLCCIHQQVTKQRRSIERCAEGERYAAVGMVGGRDRAAWR
jgi:hypothetical protein